MCKYFFLVLGYRYSLSVVSFDTLKLLSLMRTILSLFSLLHVLLVSCLIHLSKLEAIKSHSLTSSKISIVSPWTLASPSFLELIFVYVTKKSHSHTFLYGRQSSQTHPLNIYPFPTEQLPGFSLGPDSSSSIHLCGHSALPSFLALDTKATYLVKVTSLILPLACFCYSCFFVFPFPVYNQLVKLRQRTKQTVMFWIIRFLIIAPIVLSMLHVNPCTLMYSQNPHHIFVKLFVVPDTQPVSCISESVNDWMNEGFKSSLHLRFTLT